MNAKKPASYEREGLIATPTANIFRTTNSANRSSSITNSNPDPK